MSSAEPAIIRIDNRSGVAERSLKHVLDAGDIAWISFSRQAGHEQSSRRLAVVLSPAVYNAKTSLMICCPVTTQIENHRFESLSAISKDTCQTKMR